MYPLEKRGSRNDAALSSFAILGFLLRLRSKPRSPGSTLHPVGGKKRQSSILEKEQGVGCRGEAEQALIAIPEMPPFAFPILPNV